MSVDVYTRMLMLLREGEFRATERIGDERQLALKLGVTRNAMRQVLVQLEAEGRIRRKIGRGGGVFAADQKIERQVNTSQSVPDFLRQQGFTVSTEVISAHLGTASPAESRALELFAVPDDEGHVFRVTRARCANGEPWSVETSIMPARRFPGLLRQPLETSLYHVFDEVYGLRPEASDETIEVVPSGAEHAQYMGIAEGDPVFKVIRVCRARFGTPIEFAVDYFRADRTRVHTRKLGYVAPNRSAEMKAGSLG
ncbi:GntR family transcriptional regulator [Citricoccus sp. GCM10030269]|uniref:GntR family transcriptional regulator n=1 Tax=Citricoccus sp. GCM10030269 TaxID=3273388 RepID=UPI003621ABCA